MRRWREQSNDRGDMVILLERPSEMINEVGLRTLKEIIKSPGGKWRLGRDKRDN
jgi:hypothetical protein